jgi:hypothetical protein
MAWNNSRYSRNLKLSNDGMIHSARLFFLDFVHHRCYWNYNVSEVGFAQS